MTIEEKIKQQFPKARIKDKGYTFKKGIGETGRVFMSEFKDYPTHIFFTDTKDGVIRYLPHESLIKAMTGQLDGITYDSEYNGSYFFDKTHLLKWNPEEPVKPATFDESRLDFLPKKETISYKPFTEEEKSKEIRKESKYEKVIGLIRKFIEEGVEIEVNITIK